MYGPHATLLASEFAAPLQAWTGQEHQAVVGHMDGCYYMSMFSPIHPPLSKLDSSSGSYKRQFPWKSISFVPEVYLPTLMFLREVPLKP